jgi:hypothetical protein
MNQYGSRQIFFRRVWARLHSGGNSNSSSSLSPDVVDHTARVHTPKATISDTISDDTENKHNATAVRSNVTTTAVGDDNVTTGTIPWDRIIGLNNRIVDIDTDRGLIPDVQLGAMAQMEICYLTEADQIGWFKDRSIGCVGLCCKHCRGRPSFGRYFPNSVRSMAQTTSSQTIISHVTLYCPQCPNDIRDIIMQLQRFDNSNVPSTTPSTASKYGSRKVFFDRVWKRMHAQVQTNMTTSAPAMIDDATTIAMRNEPTTTLITESCTDGTLKNIPVGIGAILTEPVLNNDTTNTIGPLTNPLQPNMETGRKQEMVIMSMKRSLASDEQDEDKSTVPSVANFKRTKKYKC